MTPSSKTIAACLQELAICQPDKKLLGSAAGWLTANQVWSTAEAAALRLLEAGIRPHNYVALQACRNTDTVLLLLALRIIGAVVILTDPHSRPETILAECEAPVTVSASICYAAPNRFHISRACGTSLLILEHSEEGTGLLTPAVNSREPGYVIFTSGSTGKKKAVVLTDYNLVNNLADSQPLGCYSEQDIALGVLPLEHVFGLVLLAGTAVLHYALFFPESTDIASVLHTVESERITRMNGVPSLYQAMAAQCGAYDISSLRAGFIGGAPVTAQRLAALEEQLGMTLIPVYGMSECIGISCADGKDPVAVRADGVGRVYSMNTVMILDENGNPAQNGQTGEICVNGPSRMWGYLDQPMDTDTFLPTGDLGYLDEDNTLHICSRKKDIIIRNGKNISPRKIEDALMTLPGVRGAVVVGLPDEQVGELPYAMVAGIVDPAQLKPLLPKNELPAGFLCVEELPVTFSGKPDKIKIREVLRIWKNG